MREREREREREEEEEEEEGEEEGERYSRERDIGLSSLLTPFKVAIESEKKIE